MIQSRLPSAGGSNAGLKLMRSVPWPKDDQDARAAFFRGVTEIKADDTYRMAFARFQTAMRARGALCVTATLGGPLAVGLGNESPTETGLTLNRVYGMPVIPGSAIKGACRRAAAGQGADSIFGSSDAGGTAIFHDAWYDPTGDTRSPFVRDTVTVHHPEYYRTKGGVFPTDFDDPNPVSLIVVRPGARFLFALELPCTDWSPFAEAMLLHTLTEIGIGGKTNAGYGWVSDYEVYRPPVVLSSEERLHEFQPKIAVLVAGTLGDAALKLLDHADDSMLKRLIAQALKVKAESLKIWDKAAEKRWRKAIEEALA